MSIGLDISPRHDCPRGRWCTDHCIDRRGHVDCRIIAGAVVPRRIDASAILASPERLAQLIEQASRDQHDSMLACIAMDARQQLGGHLQRHLERMAREVAERERLAEAGTLPAGYCVEVRST